MILNFGGVTRASVTEVTSTTFHQEVEESKIPVIVQVVGSGCGPCKQMKPIVDAVSEGIGETVKVVRFDIQKNRALADRFGVRAIPTLLFIQDGVVVGRTQGTLSQARLIEKAYKAFG